MANGHNTVSGRPARRQAQGRDPDQWRYVFLRPHSKPGVERSERAFRILAGAKLPGAAILSLEHGRWDWGDACALRFQTPRPAALLAQQIKAVSEHAAQWIVHDGRGRGVEWPTPGPLSRYFDRTSSLSGIPGTYAQIFLSFYGDEQDDEEAVNLITSALEGTCLPIMHPEDGRIFFYQTTEIALDIASMFDKHHQELRKLCRWAVCDRTGATVSSDGRDDAAWEPIELLALTRGG